MYFPSLLTFHPLTQQVLCSRTKLARKNLMGRVERKSKWETYEMCSLGGRGRSLSAGVRLTCGLFAFHLTIAGWWGPLVCHRSFASCRNRGLTPVASGTARALQEHRILLDRTPFDFQDQDAFAWCKQPPPGSAGCAACLCSHVSQKKKQQQQRQQQKKESKGCCSFPRYMMARNNREGVSEASRMQMLTMCKMGT